jgi:hypothetical protein
MTIYNIKAHFESCELIFKLTDLTKITPAIEKKLKTLGFPEMWAVPSPKAVRLPMNGVAVVSDKSIDMSNNIPISSPTEGGAFECNYIAENHSIVISFSGEFNIWNTEDIKPLKNVSCLYISAIRLQDIKGKSIKFAKDNYGMADKVEANVTGDYPDEGLCYQVPVSLTFKKD